MAENQLSDADISRGCRQNSPRSWRQLVREYTPLVYRIALDRGLIVMRCREGFSESEISQATRMPVGTVKTQLHRARAKLKKYLSPLFQELSQ